MAERFGPRRGTLVPPFLRGLPTKQRGERSSENEAAAASLGMWHVQLRRTRGSQACKAKGWEGSGPPPCTQPIRKHSLFCSRPSCLAVLLQAKEGARIASVLPGPLSQSPPPWPELCP